MIKNNLPYTKAFITFPAKISCKVKILKFASIAVFAASSCLFLSNCSRFEDEIQPYSQRADAEAAPGDTNTPEVEIQEVDLSDAEQFQASLARLGVSEFTATETYLAVSAFDSIFGIRYYENDGAYFFNTISGDTLYQISYDTEGMVNLEKSLIYEEDTSLVYSSSSALDSYSSFLDFQDINKESYFQEILFRFVYYVKAESSLSSIAYFENEIDPNVVVQTIFTCYSTSLQSARNCAVNNASDRCGGGGIICIDQAASESGIDPAGRSFVKLNYTCGGCN